MLRFHKKIQEVAFVTLGNILDKINLLFLHNESPVTFSIEDVEKGPVSAVKTFLLYIMQICPKYLLSPQKR